MTAAGIDPGLTAGAVAAVCPRRRLVRVAEWTRCTRNRQHRWLVGGSEPIDTPHACPSLALGLARWQSDPLRVVTVEETYRGQAILRAEGAALAAAEALRHHSGRSVAVLSLRTQAWASALGVTHRSGRRHDAVRSVLDARGWDIAAHEPADARRDPATTVWELSAHAIDAIGCALAGLRHLETP